MLPVGGQVVALVLQSLAGEVARIALPAAVALVGLLGAGWLSRRSRPAAALLGTGMALVLAALALDALLFPALNALAFDGALDVGPVGYRVVAALTHLAEGAGLALGALAGLWGAGPSDDEEDA